MAPEPQPVRRPGLTDRPDKHRSLVCCRDYGRSGSTPGDWHQRVIVRSPWSTPSPVPWPSAEGRSSASLPGPSGYGHRPTGGPGGPMTAGPRGPPRPVPPLQERQHSLPRALGPAQGARSQCRRGLVPSLWTSLVQLYAGRGSSRRACGVDRYEFSRRLAEAARTIGAEPEAEVTRSSGTHGHGASQEHGRG